MQMYTLDRTELDAAADTVKVAVLKGLVADGLLTATAADGWAALNTIITTKKTLWRTLTDKWRKEAAPDDGTVYYQCVKRRG